MFLILYFQEDEFKKVPVTVVIQYCKNYSMYLFVSDYLSTGIILINVIQTQLLTCVSYIVITGIVIN